MKVGSTITLIPITIPDANGLPGNPDRGMPAFAWVYDEGAFPHQGVTLLYHFTGSDVGSNRIMFLMSL